MPTKKPAQPDPIREKVSKLPATERRRLEGVARGAGKNARTVATPELIHLRARVEVLEESERVLFAEQRKADHRLSSERSRHKATKQKLADRVFHNDALLKRGTELGALVKTERERANAANDAMLRLRQSLEDDSHPFCQTIARLQAELVEVRTAWAAEESELRAKLGAAENHKAQLVEGCQAEQQAKEAAEATIRQLEQECASLRRQKNTSDADLAEVRAGRDRERREYLEARRVHDVEVIAANERTAQAAKDAVGFHQACEAEVRDHAHTMAAERAGRERIAELGCEAAASATVAERHRQRADLAEAHLGNVRRELAAAKEALLCNRADFDRAEAMALRQNGIMLELRKELAESQQYAKCLNEAFNLDRQNTHRELTEGIANHASNPEIARTLRAVRVMLFPPHGLLPTVAPLG